MNVNDKLIESLRREAESQAKKNYKWLEIESRVLLALLDEIERARLVDLRFDRPKEPALRD